MLTTRFTARSVTDDDREFLCRLYASTRADEMALVTWWSDAEKEAFLRFQFDAQSKYWGERFPDASFDIVEQRGEPVGRLYVDRRPNEIRLIDIALLPEHRGKGLGGELMAQVLAEGKARGLPVSIHVEHNNPALRLYRRLGFEKVEEQGVYFLMEWLPLGRGPRSTQTPAVAAD
jgi:ribosomal protein S18 acetylase RimI-like enzyme